MNTPSASLVRAFLFLTLTTLAATRAEAASMMTYISLGDSIAYGSGSTQDAASGISSPTGFVSQFANTMAQANGGTAPNVINLALPGETLASYSGGNADPSANTNYNSMQATQSLAFMHYMATSLAAGQQISTVTVALGTQDIMNILNTPGFASMSLSQQATALTNGLSTIQTEYAALLTQIRNVLPNAQIDLIGAYNPFHATPNDPLAPIAEPAFLGLNKIIQAEATATGSTYVDTYTAFLGHESAYTNILGGTGNITPTPAGYSAIAGALDSTVVPEPSTLFVAAIGLAGLAWSRRKARVA